MQIAAHQPVAKAAGFLKRWPQWKPLAYHAHWAYVYARDTKQHAVVVKIAGPTRLALDAHHRAAFAEGLIDGFHRWCKSTNAWRLNEIMFELRYLRDYAAAYAAGDRSLFLNDEQFMFDQAERWRRVSQIAHGAHSRTPYLSGYLGRDAA